MRPPLWFILAAANLCVLTTAALTLYEPPSPTAWAAAVCALLVSAVGYGLLAIANVRTT